MSPRHLILPAWLIGALAPRLYNEIGLAISGPPGGAAVLPSASSWVTESVIALVPAIGAAAAKIYPAPAPEQAALLHYAAVDLAWAAVFALTTILLLAPGMLAPAPFNALFPHFKQRIKTGRRVLLFLGSISMCLLALIVAFAGVIEIFHGDVVTDAHRYCSVSDGWGKHSRCLAHADHDFAGTVRKLGWVISGIAAFAGLIFWAIPGSLRYAYWIATWKGRRSRFS
ncbi:hypothetical protein [Dongia sp.]|uniref:hypothetical protein n=1 Tax=Dongia sp. TaxID=1977262 RepID=UPI0037523D0C